MSYLIPPRSKASDLQKGYMTQDEMLRIAAANDANIASARKAYKQGVVTPLTPIQDATPDELQADTAKQEADAMSGLMNIGFRPQEASEIVALLDPDERFKFNQSFPDIKADLAKRYNIRLITPTFFVEYLKKYIEELDASKGLNTGGLSSISRNINALITSVNEIRQILPDQPQMNELLRNAARAVRNTEQRALLEPILDRIDVLRGALPDPVDYARIEALGGADRQRIIQEIQTATANLPTKQQVDRIITSVAEGRTDAFAQISALADSVDNQMKPRLDAIMKEVREVGDAQNQIQTQLERQARQATPGRATLQDWDGVSIILTDEDWSALKVEGKRAFLKSRIPLGEQIVPLKELNKLNVAELNDVYDNWVQQFGVALQSASSGKIPASSASTTSINSGNTSNATTDLYGNKGGFGLRGITKRKIGKGIAVEQEPTYKEFGKYAIHMPQLINQDILNVKYKSLGQIPKFKPIPVSETLKDFVIDLLDTGKANPRVYQQIPPEERKFFENVATGAGVFSKLGLKKTTLDNEAEDLKRFEILRGEYIAGNNSASVLKELRRLVVKFMNTGRIPKSEGTNFLMELSI